MLRSICCGKVSGHAHQWKAGLATAAWVPGDVPTFPSMNQSLPGATALHWWNRNTPSGKQQSTGRKAKLPGFGQGPLKRTFSERHLIYQFHFLFWSFDRFLFGQFFPKGKVSNQMFQLNFPGSMPFSLSNQLCKGSRIWTCDNTTTSFQRCSSPVLGDAASFRGRCPLYFADFFFEIFGRVERPAGAKTLMMLPWSQKFWTRRVFLPLISPGFEAVKWQSREGCVMVCLFRLFIAHGISCAQ